MLSWWQICEVVKFWMHVREMWLCRLDNKVVRLWRCVRQLWLCRQDDKVVKLWICESGGYSDTMKKLWGCVRDLWLFLQDYKNVKLHERFLAIPIEWQSCVRELWLRRQDDRVLKLWSCVWELWLFRQDDKVVKLCERVELCWLDDIEGVWCRMGLSCGTEGERGRLGLSHFSQPHLIYPSSECRDLFVGSA